MSIDWNKRDVVDEYARASTDPTKHWYENEVNVPSIVALLGAKGSRVLDFGCGPGNMTADLAKDFVAAGADGSELMIEQAQQDYPDTEFFVWDGMSPLPADMPKFDAIICKLTIEFVADLSTLAGNLRNALVPGGALIISVAHPMLVAHYNTEDPYWEESTDHIQIGTTGLFVAKIQRSIQDYFNSFIAAGFTVAKVAEPSIPKAVAEHYSVKPVDLQIPKRLNIKFTV